MFQCSLVDINGVLGLGRSCRETRDLCPLDNHPWIASELDNISVEELIDSTATKRRSGLSHPSVVPETPQRIRGVLSTPTRQYHFSKQDGVIVLRRPIHRHHPSLGHEGGEASASATKCTNGSSQSQVSILTLPPELRLRIYHYLLVSGRDYDCPIICPNTDHFRIVAGANKSGSRVLYAEILITCRLINREGTPVLYGENMFSQEFYWPRRWHVSKNRKLQWPLSDSSPLRAARGLQYISRVCISQQHHQWLRNGELKVLRDFPSLTELHININMCDKTANLDPEVLWKDAMRSAGKKQPRLKSVKCRLGLAYDDDYRSWLERCRGRRLDFSLHHAIKKQFARWMAEESLFSHRSIAWCFVTHVSEYAGPSCSIEFLIDDVSVAGDDAARKAAPVCRLIGDYVLNYDVETT
ncbi:hypothetical protein QQZ08_005124 [Neonectria magnoliae]|uniref:F-box domain-containing protein n=1 Tax=Neonectria magnoliae TaxID=2732573 RepID=A0ABR1I494_9HYPO